MRFGRTLALSLLALSLWAQDFQVVREDWYVVRIGGVKSGFVRQTLKQSGEVLRLEVHNETRMKRLGAEIALVQRTRHDETVGGKPLRFEERKLMSAQETVFTGEIRDGKLHLTTLSGGAESRKEIDWKPEWTFAMAQEKLIREKTAPSAEFSFDSYNTDFGKGFRTTVKVVGKEKISVGGREFETYKSDTQVDLMPGVETAEWRDLEGRLVKSTVKMMGLEIVTERSDAATAMMNEKGDLPEVFATTVVRPKQKFGSARKFQEARYRIALKEGTPQEKDFKFDGQKVEKIEGAALTLHVSPATPPAEAPAIPVTEDALKEFLRPNDYLQSADARIVAAAKEAVGAETDSWKAARKVEKWVHEKIAKKTFGVGFASAKETCETLQGDCTEHSVLAAALARAAGIPSRVAIGLVSVGDIFGGHMWPEVWVGRWVALEPTLGGDFFDASHIKMGESSLNETGFAAEFAGMLIYIGKMDMDILEYQADGKRIAPE
jgi:hypothetical protein